MLAAAGARRDGGRGGRVVRLAGERRVLAVGVRAVLATSYERIHRSNLIGMGVLPLEFQDGEGAVDHGIDGTERFDIHGIAEGLEPGALLSVTATREDGTSHDFTVVCRIDTPDEMEYFRHGGILDYVLRSLWQA